MSEGEAGIVRYILTRGGRDWRAVYQYAGDWYYYDGQFAPLTRAGVSKLRLSSAAEWAERFGISHDLTDEGLVRRAINVNAPEVPPDANPILDILDEEMSRVGRSDTAMLHRGEEHTVIDRDYQVREE